MVSSGADERAVEGIWLDIGRAFQHHLWERRAAGCGQGVLLTHSVCALCGDLWEAPGSNMASRRHETYAANRCRRRYVSPRLKKRQKLAAVTQGEVIHVTDGKGVKGGCFAPDSGD
jgi:hypothetical protein